MPNKKPLTPREAGVFKSNIVTFRLPKDLDGPLGLLMEDCLKKGMCRKPERTLAILLCIVYGLLAHRNWRLTGKGKPLTDMAPQLAKLGALSYVKPSLPDMAITAKWKERIDGRQEA